MHALVHAWGELGNKINSKVFECKYSAGFVCIVTSAWLQLFNIPPDRAEFAHLGINKTTM